MKNVPRMFVYVSSYMQKLEHLFNCLFKLLLSRVKKCFYVCRRQIPAFTLTGKKRGSHIFVDFLFGSAGCFALETLRSSTSTGSCEMRTVPPSFCTAGEKVGMLTWHEPPTGLWSPFTGVLLPFE